MLFRSPKDAIKKKIAFLTEDRKGQGLVLSLDVRTNLILANMKGFSNGPFLNKGKIEASGKENVESLKIKTPSLDEVTAQLSGGNQQKVVIGKWVNTDADIFIFDEPTRGIDVGAKIEVYLLIVGIIKPRRTFYGDAPQSGIVADAVNQIHGRNHSTTLHLRELV